MTKNRNIKTVEIRLYQLKIEKIKNIILKRILQENTVI